jgi:hypothetical protein
LTYVNAAVADARDISSMDRNAVELQAEIARYERLARAITDRDMRARLNELRLEAEAQLAALRSEQASGT